jgi:hypothetical protein
MPSESKDRHVLALRRKHTALCEYRQVHQQKHSCRLRATT